MAERSHAVHQIQRLPQLGGQLLRAGLTLLATGIAIIWFYPELTAIAILAILLGVGLPLAFNNPFQELDLRTRTHNGAMMRFNLDAMLV
jgi:ATP-binding cassette subfamily B protein